MDKEGDCQEVKLDRLNECITPYCFSHFDMKMFRQMCIMAGCDYLESIPGLGIRTAYATINKFNNSKEVHNAFFCC
jgi:exonuclease 1